MATAAALLWANSPWSASYDQLWHTTVAIEAGPLHLAEDVRHWVNDGRTSATPASPPSRRWEAGLGSLLLLLGANQRAGPTSDAERCL